MQNNILEYLEETVKRVPDKIAYADDEIQLNFGQVHERSRRIGSKLSELGAYHEPIIIYMKKSPCTLTAFFGAVYAGCFYVLIDEEMPKRRIELILESTKARYLIYDESTIEHTKKLGFSGQTLFYEDCIQAEINEERLRKIREAALDVDPVYILFTSGSTGVPKGVVGYHRGVIDYIDTLSEVMEFSEDTIFGNQTPLYVDACMKEIYPTIKFGATTWLIPKEYFMIPLKLVQYLNEHKVNTICWVVSALTMISAFGTFDEEKPQYLHTVSAGSEVFPIKQFNIWKNALPEAKFFNLYGPTEGTGVCCYYRMDRLFEENEVIPIGRPFKNTQILLLDSEGREVLDGEEGEICIRGIGVTLGYYNNTEKTEEVFTQNPTNPYYFDRIYRTGDLGKKNEKGELIFISRKDYQIKHMGHRIELGEIEADVSLIDGVKSCCCVYVKEKNKMVLYYVGDVDKKSLTVALKERLPRYMIPNAIKQLDVMPLTANGKMDRLKMQQMYCNSSGKSAHLLR